VGRECATVVPTDGQVNTKPTKGVKTYRPRCPKLHAPIVELDWQFRLLRRHFPVRVFVFEFDGSLDQHDATGLAKEAIFSLVEVQFLEIIGKNERRFVVVRWRRNR